MKPRCPGSDANSVVWQMYFLTWTANQTTYIEDVCTECVNRGAVTHVCSARGHHSCTAHFTLLIRKVAYSLTVFSARFTRIKALQSKRVKLSTANRSQRESEHLYPGTSQVGPGLSVLTVLPSQSGLINRPLSCCSLAKTEERCSWVVDPADVRGAAGHSSPQSRSICEHQSFTQRGFLGRVR